MMKFQSLNSSHRALWKRKEKKKKKSKSPIWSCIFWVDRDRSGPSLPNCLWRLYGPRRLLWELTMMPPRRGVNPAQAVHKYCQYSCSNSIFRIVLLLKLFGELEPFCECRAWILCVSIICASGFRQGCKAGAH